MDIVKFDLNTTHKATKQSQRTSATHTHTHTHTHARAQTTYDQIMVGGVRFEHPPADTIKLDLVFHTSRLATRRTHSDVFE
jgi:hypothetical protein